MRLDKRRAGQDYAVRLITERIDTSKAIMLAKAESTNKGEQKTILGYCGDDTESYVQLRLGNLYISTSTLRCCKEHSVCGM